MKPLPHQYQVELTGAPAGYAALSSAGLPDVMTSPPVEYGGPGDAWSPEHLLLAAVSSCFLFTFRAVARVSQVDFLNVDVETRGTVAKAAGVVRFTDVVVRATVTTAEGVDEQAVRRAVDKAAGHCLVSSSLIAPVHVEATIQSSRRAA